MALDAQQLEAQQIPTDWSKFDASSGIDAARFGQSIGGLPPGMGPGFDDKLHVKFFMRPRIDIAKSEEANRPIYKDVPHIEIMIPGDKNNVVLAEVWEQHIRRFPRHWEQFQAGIKNQVIGTPLKAAPFLTESHIEELAYFKIVTIEQLANLADSNMTFMGAREMQQAARRYLDKVSGNEALMARVEALEAENRRLAAVAVEAAEVAVAGVDDIDELDAAPPRLAAGGKVRR
jgi:hypothetical protein